MFEEIWPDRDFLPRSLPKEDDVDDGEDGGKAEGNLVETEQGIGVEEQRQRGDVQNEFVDEENAIQQQQQ
ncbi:unnamed protein product [Anisakis simplex]|uniref:Uncharacterized protein n=1 Tax=Anisakis simplex TaxID=6269 RepID=A0A0M3JIH4_ANISI|nr:unnamed protein product [Anisakis simplex]